MASESAIAKVEGDLEDGVELPRRLYSFLFPPKPIPVPTEAERKPYAEEKANWFSQLYFWWLTPLMNTGYRRTLTENDLFQLTDRMRVQLLTDLFDANFRMVVSRHKRNHLKAKGIDCPDVDLSLGDVEGLEDFKVPDFFLAEVLFRTFTKDILISMLLALLTLCGYTTSPLVTKELIKFVQEKTAGLPVNVGRGVGYAIGVALLTGFSSIMLNHFQYRSFLIGIKVRSILTTAMLEKSFRLSNKAKQKHNQAKITSLVATDLSRVEFGFLLLGFLPIMPIPMAISIAILIINIGATSLISIAVFLVFVIAICGVAFFLFKFREEVAVIIDKRVALFKELLSNLRMIKFYSWEVPFFKNFLKIRKDEMKIIYKIQNLRSILDAIAMSLVGITTMVAFLVLWAIEGKTRSPANIFSSVLLFDVLGMMIFFLPMGLAMIADMLLGFKRVGEILVAEEMQPSPRYRHDLESLSETALKITNGKFQWELFEKEEDEKEKKEREKEEKKKKKEEKKQSKKKGYIPEVHKSEKPKDMNVGNRSLGLSDINLEIKKGEFVIIVGSVGSGKTSLLNALAGTMKCDDGEVDVNGSLVFCRDPWIQSSTIRDNILFGKELDKEHYDQTVYSCSLQSDFEIFSAGDYTEVGERGITLSGGQKARLNLARAVYANKEIMLMDDVLSAVDARVGKHIVNECFLNLLKDRTRVLATNHLAFLGVADRVIFMNGDSTIDVGTVEELTKRNKKFKKLLTHEKKLDLRTDDGEKSVISTPSLSSADQSDFIESQKEEKGHDTSQERQLSKSGTFDEDEEAHYKNYNANKDISKGKIVEIEDRAVSRIKPEVYGTYVRFGAGFAGMYGFIFLFGILIVLTSFTEIFMNTWLSFWLERKFPSLSDHFYIGIYIMLTFLFVICVSAEFLYLSRVANESAKNLHVAAAKKVLYSRTSFLDTTPMGRVLNRFTKDTDALDNEISEQMRSLFLTLGRIGGAIVLDIIYIPWAALMVPFIVLVFSAAASYYQASCRETKRLEAVQRSFVYNNLTESLTGMETIKGYDAAGFFFDKNNNSLNNMNEASFLVIALQSWVALILESMGLVFFLIVALLCVNGVFHLSPASVGLLVTYTYQMTSNLTQMIRTGTQVENFMNSAERLSHYALKLPQEDGFSVNDYTVPGYSEKSWPNEGVVEFRNASMAYRPELPLVLKNLSFKTKPSEKIGICGRTGAGKSSIMQAIYRLTELAEGKVVIDDVDVSKLNLKSLRTKLSIIPQDPILFNGTIRSNLDPFGEHTDDSLWVALRRTRIFSSSRMEEVKLQKKDSEELDKFHLDQPVVDEGANFSLGERQLISFARALVRNTKILILDEATSSVDYETDSKIQETISAEFADCTILCIAHRLRTIIHYDRVLTMDKGEVREFDTPLNLFNDVDGIFRLMCDKSGILRSDFD